MPCAETIEWSRGGLGVTRSGNPSRKTTCIRPPDLCTASARGAGAAKLQSAAVVILVKERQRNCGILDVVSIREVAVIDRLGRMMKEDRNAPRCRRSV
jgi:hypothetical protein